MTRRGNTDSLLRGRIKSLVRYKPQLPHVSGPIKTVRFFGLNTNPTGELVEILGTISLHDGQLVADPPDKPALLFALNEPVHVEDARGRMVTFDSRAHPQKFLKALPKQYHGSYFWAEAVAD